MKTVAEIKAAREQKELRSNEMHREYMISMLLQHGQSVPGPFDESYLDIAKKFPETFLITEVTKGRFFPKKSIKISLQSYVV